VSALLLLHRLRKSFGERVLLDIPELAIDKGAAYVLTGRNGSGKTTLLRIIAGLDTAQHGSMEFGSERVGFFTYPERLRRKIVYVHQHPYLFHTSLRHNLEYGLKHRGLQPAERGRRVEDAIAWAGLQQQCATPPAKMSGGEAQRAALARARALQPELLLLDEPTSNLDRAGRGQVLALLGQLRDERRAVVVACHDQEVIGLDGFTRLRLHDGGITRQSG
jgi:tungstate transport system ATP-binding protein